MVIWAAILASCWKGALSGAGNLADEAANDRLYQRFGFSLVSSETVLGVKTWHIQGEPQF
ncbi:hypothetical protein [Dyadobacter sp. MSC1_007]|jgi:divalent metal cation (Fe/Co/Zn/Cd) transporter|uniref:hypothetical protein n=1 Tax=Dyadobacter sp. MSC1_007 TaxID=2909264 RepID=UPI00202E3AB3|nr:hypothetical protein [Dyadobacter sp. MSC1_007]